MVLENKLSLFYILFNRIFALFIIIILIPLLVIISLFIILTSYGKPLFLQERMGHNGKKFSLYKFRTMVLGAEKIKDNYKHLNYADGPVFKIKNDPRFTRIGKFLSESHLDELPQLFNVIKGDMLLVGFRPPLYEEVKKYSKKQMLRFEGYPGITSIWAVNGGHNTHSFNEWIKSDIDYENKRGYINDLNIIIKTIKLLFQ